METLKFVFYVMIVHFLCICNKTIVIGQDSLMFKIPQFLDNKILIFFLTCLRY